MWDHSYRWQRRTQLIAGVVLLLSGIAALAVAVTTPAARRAWGGTREVLAEITSPAAQTISTTVPASLQTEIGTLVYLERADGVAQVVGRVVHVAEVSGELVEIQIRMLAPASDPVHAGGVLKGAPASLDLRDAVQLLLSPDPVEVEAALARDAVWPSVRTHVMPSIADNLIREIGKEQSAFAKQDKAIIVKSIDELRAELQPLEEQLAERLAKRSWEVIGVSGVAGGIWRSTSNSVEEQNIAIADWWWGLFGSESNRVPRDRPFLSEKATQELRAALHEETRAFWQENRAAIVAALAKVANERRGDIESAFNERWAGLLYERALLPAWRDGQDEVLESVQVYAKELAARRLLNEQGGPRLLFAHALRSSLKISNEPLLVFSPTAAGGASEVTFEPLLH